jgi:hypothetical protein
VPGDCSCKSPLVNELSWSYYCMQLCLILRRAVGAGSGRSRRSLRSGSRTAKVLRAVVARSAMAGHAHVVRRGRSRAVGSANTRVVLRSTPAEADAGVADRVALHLVDGHLGSVAVDELDKTAALARWYLDIGDFAEALEE